MREAYLSKSIASGAFDRFRAGLASRPLAVRARAMELQVDLFCASLDCFQEGEPDGDQLDIKARADVRTEVSI